MPGCAHFRFSTKGDEVEAFPDPGVRAERITEIYHRAALPLALQTAGYEVLHASAVSHAGGVHVFCGASHVGKSTIAYGLSRRSFEVWADDAVAFKADAAAITSFPLPFALRLRHDVADFFEEARTEKSPNGKTEALRHRGAGPRTIASVSLLERGSDSTISRLSSAGSLPAILYHSYYFSLDDSAVRHRMTDQFLELVARVPLFRVTLRPGLRELGDFLDDLERRVLLPAPAEAVSAT